MWEIIRKLRHILFWLSSWSIDHGEGIIWIKARISMEDCAAPIYYVLRNWYKRLAIEERHFSWSDSSVSWLAIRFPIPFPGIGWPFHLWGRGSCKWELSPPFHGCLSHLMNHPKILHMDQQRVGDWIKMLISWIGVAWSGNYRFGLDGAVKNQSLSISIACL